MLESLFWRTNFQQLCKPGLEFAAPGQINLCRHPHFPLGIGDQASSPPGQQVEAVIEPSGTVVPRQGISPSLRRRPALRRRIDTIGEPPIGPGHLYCRFEPAGDKTAVDGLERSLNRQRFPVENHLIRIPGGPTVLRMVEVERRPVSLHTIPRDVNRISLNCQPGLGTAHCPIIIEANRHRPIEISRRHAEHDRPASGSRVEPDHAGTTARSDDQFGHCCVPPFLSFGEIDVHRAPSPAIIAALKQMDAFLLSRIAIGNGQIQVALTVPHQLRPPRKRRPDGEMPWRNPSGSSILGSPVAEPEFTSRPSRLLPLIADPSDVDRTRMAVDPDCG